MSTLYVPSPTGGRIPVPVVAGRTLSEAATELRCNEAGAQWGFEEKRGEQWASRPASTRIQAGRVYRIGLPPQTTQTGLSRLWSLLHTLLRRS
jgi:hypothetical protein